MKRAQPLGQFSQNMLCKHDLKMLSLWTVSGHRCSRCGL